MEETQAIDFDDLPLEEELSENDNDLNQVIPDVSCSSDWLVILLCHLKVRLLHRRPANYRRSLSLVTHLPCTWVS